MITVALLFRIEFNNKLLFNGCVDLIALGKVYNFSSEFLSVNSNPCSNGFRSVSFQNCLEFFAALALLANSNYVACAEKVRSDINTASVNLKMTVANKLSGVGSGRSKACTINNVIKTALKDS